MFERFTDRARKMMALANQEAQRFNHEYIGTEHLLLGLVKEGGGVAANSLKNLGVDLRKVRLEVEKIIKSGTDMITMGKLPQTAIAKKVIQKAIDESRDLNHNYVGTEHLLLGLIAIEEGIAHQVFQALELKYDVVKAEIIAMLKSKDITAPDTTKQLAQADAYRALLEKAIDLTAENGMDIVASFAQVVADYRKAQMAEL